MALFKINDLIVLRIICQADKCITGFIVLWISLLQSSGHVLVLTIDHLKINFLTSILLLLCLEEVQSCCYSRFRNGLSISTFDVHLSVFFIEICSLLLAEVSQILTQFFVLLMAVFHIEYHFGFTNSR